MAEEGRRARGLGRGLSALLAEDDGDLAALDRRRGMKEVAIEMLSASRFQPRRLFAVEELDELARSIAEKGILSPILVRRQADNPNAYEIVAGERRWRAAQKAGLHKVPVSIKDVTDSEALEVALVENIQRQDLNPIEEAEGYKRLLDDFDHTQADIAKLVGKSRSHVANMVRLLSLPPALGVLLERGEISAGHARALVTSADPVALANEIIAAGLNVRQAERLAGMAKGRGGRGAATAVAKSADIRALERRLGEHLGLKVDIGDNSGKGVVRIHYKSLEQFDAILERLERGE